MTRETRGGTRFCHGGITIQISKTKGGAKEIRRKTYSQGFFSSTEKSSHWRHDFSATTLQIRQNNSKEERKRKGGSKLTGATPS
jgi:hypothetical protein